MTSDADLGARLRAAKLRALVADVVGALPDGVDASPLGGGAALRHGATGVVLVGAAGAERALGPALAWALRAEVTTLHVLADDPDAAGVLARRAGLFDLDVRVHVVEGRATRVATPAPHLPVLEPARGALEAAEPLREAGATIVVEHGVVLAELDGLEIGRVTDGPDGPTLEVGVGRFDREAAAVMEAVRGHDELTAGIFAAVRTHRRTDASPHLLNRIGRARWLRADLLADPGRVGARDLVVVEPPLPRDNLLDPVPASALGRTDGGTVVVTASVGVDLDLVPTAADTRDRYDPAAELVLALPARDRYPVVGDLAARLRRPARIVAVEGSWPS